MKYNDITRQYFEAAPNAGTLAGEEVLRGSAGERDGPCWVQFELRLHGDDVAVCAFQAFGCPHTVAVCAYLAERAAGMTLRSVLPEEPASLMARFGVPEHKRGRLLVIEDAWRALYGRQR